MTGSITELQHVWLRANCRAGFLQSAAFCDKHLHVFLSLVSLAHAQGVGLVLPIQQVGSLEVNFCKVLAMRDTDRPKHGIQVGFSPQLL